MLQFFLSLSSSAQIVHGYFTGIPHDTYKHTDRLLCDTHTHTHTHMCISCIPLTVVHIWAPEQQGSNPGRQVHLGDKMLYGGA